VFLEVYNTYTHPLLFASRYHSFPDMLRVDTTQQLYHFHHFVTFIMSLFMLWTLHVPVHGRTRRRPNNIDNICVLETISEKLNNNPCLLPALATFPNACRQDHMLITFIALFFFFWSFFSLGCFSRLRNTSSYVLTDILRNYVILMLDFNAF